MSLNLVQLISSQLGGGTVNKISSLIGESPERTQTAVGAAVPTLLAGLSQTASTPEGAQRLANAVDRQDPNIESNFASSLGSYRPDTASNQLSQLLGGGLAGNLTSALGRFTGMKTGASTGLLAMLAPLCLGVLGRQKRSMGLDSAGLANLLGGQRQNIANAMPSGLSSLVGGIPGMSAFTQREPEYAYAGGTPSYTSTSRPISEARPLPTEHRPSAARWLIPLLLGLGILWALWGWNRHRHTTTYTEPTTVTQPTISNVTPAAPPPPTEQPRSTAPTEQQPSSTTTTPGAGTATTTTSVNALTTGLNDTLNTANSTLGSITDANSAQQYAPQLNQINDQLSSMKTQLDSLPAAAKPGVMSSIQPNIDKLQKLSQQIRGTPGVSDKIGSSLDKLDSNLSSFTGNK